MPEATDQAPVQSEATVDAPSSPEYPDYVSGDGLNLIVDGQERTVSWDDARALAQKGDKFTQNNTAAREVAAEYQQRLAGLDERDQDFLQREQSFKTAQTEWRTYAQNVERYAEGLQQPQAQQQQQFVPQEPGYQGQPQPQQQAQPQRAQSMPQEPQGQPQGDPRDQRMVEIESQMANLNLQREVEQATAHYPGIGQEGSPWRHMLATEALRSMQSGANAPFLEIASQIDQRRVDYDKGVVTGYVNKKAEAEAGPQVQPGGRPALPTPPGPLSDDEFEQDGMQKKMRMLMNPENIEGAE